MELLYSDPYYDSEDWNPDRYPAELKAAVAGLDPKAGVSKTDVGHGADFPCVLVELLADLDWKSLIAPVAVGSLFFKGKAIQENLEAWVALGKKLLGLFRRMKPTRIDEKAAVLLVLNSIVETGIDLGQLALSVQVVQLMHGPAGIGTLDKRPDAIYLITASTGKAVRVTIIKSDGKELYSEDYSKDLLRFSDI